MYMIQNAWKSITRNKARNILIGIVAFVIAVSSCIALSIRQAAETAKANTLSGLTITAQISYDRSKQMSNTMSDMKNSGTFDKGSFDFSKISGDSLTLDDYLKYTEAQSEGDSYYYSNTASLNATGDLKAYNSTDSSTSTNTTTGTTGGMANGSGTSTNSAPGGMGKGGMSFSPKGDFSLTGYSSYNALLSMFGEDGTYSITDGAMFEEGTADKTCIISDELATYNDLSVGDVITLSNPNYESETYEFTISGIYTNTSSDTGNSAFASTDPANNIYTSYETLKAVVDASTEAGNTSDGTADGTNVSLTSELKFTYTFSEAAHYESFSSAVYDLGLGEDYIVSSQDLSSYESSITPLETLSTMAGWFFLIVLGIGGVILIVLNIFNLRERKYEVGVLTAIGMKKGKVALQFIYELFAITFIAIFLGAIVGATASVPVTNALLANQVESTSSSTEQLSDNFGKDMSQTGVAPGGSGTSGNTSGSTSGGSSAGIQGNSSNGSQAPAMGGGAHGSQSSQSAGPVSYITSVSSATNLVVILELIGVGVVLTIISSLAAMVTIMRYEPLQILSSRS